MMNSKRLSHYVSLLALALSFPANAHIGSNYWKKAQAFFGICSFQQTSEQRYDQQPKKIIIKNNGGNITIRGSENQKDITLKLTKKTTAQENLSKINAVYDWQADGTVTFHTQAPSSSKSFLDYELLVPQGVALDITTKLGSIIITNVKGTVVGKTDEGNIALSHLAQETTAAIGNKGNITINKIDANLTAQTAQGNIEINGSSQGIIALTRKGSIKAHCIDLPHTSSIKLTSDSGNINCSLAPGTNAQLYAKALHGSITSDHYVTIKSYKTQLNQHAWKRFKQEIAGELGTGESEINITTNNGDIKLLDLSKKGTKKFRKTLLS